ncbi:MAG: diguanylate cyclase [Hyphomicrobiales bacterium]
MEPGLGLAIVKQIVDRLGGRVDFEAALGGGAIFTVQLPLVTGVREARNVENRGFDDLIERYELASAAQNVRQAMVRGTTLAMLRIAMDAPAKRFVADRDGEARDQTLRAAAQYLQQNVRGDDALYHTGDGRVSMLLQNISSDRALERAMVLHDELEALRVEHDGVLLEPMSFSIGLAVFPGHGDSLAGLSNAADHALDRAIAEGGARVVIASEADVLVADAELDLGASVSRAS